MAGGLLPLVTSPRGQLEDAVAIDSDTGNFFLAWHSDNLQDVNGPDSLRARLFGPSGAAKAPEIVLETGSTIGAAFSAFPLAVAYNTVTKEYLVTWKISFFDTTGLRLRDELRGRRISREGEPLGSVLLFAQRTQRVRNTQAIYAPRTNEYVLLYSLSTEAWPMEESPHFLQRVDLQGKKIGPAVRVNGNKLAGDPLLAYDTNKGRFLVAWGSVGKLWSQAFSPTLQRLGSNKVVVADTSLFTGVHVAFSSSKDQFVVFWNTHDGVRYATHARTLGTDGSFATNPVEVEIKGSLAAVAYNPKTGGHLLTYQISGRRFGLYFARLDADLRVIVQDLPVTCQSQSRVGNKFHIVFSPLRNQFLVTWWYADQGQSINVYGQRIRAVALSGSSCSGS